MCVSVLFFLLVYIFMFIYFSKRSNIDNENISVVYFIEDRTHVSVGFFLSVLCSVV